MDIINKYWDKFIQDVIKSYYLGTTNCWPIIEDMIYNAMNRGETNINLEQDHNQWLPIIQKDFGKYFEESLQNIVKSTHINPKITNKSIDRHPIDRHPMVNHQPIDRHPINRHPIDRHPIDRHPITRHRICMDLFNDVWDYFTDDFILTPHLNQKIMSANQGKIVDKLYKLTQRLWNDKKILLLNNPCYGSKACWNLCLCYVMNVLKRDRAINLILLIIYDNC
jgi:hypothetical protein